MREIKFRGQRTDTKEWIYGYYLEATAQQLGEKVPLAQARICHCIVNDGIKFYVIPETVGQYTGLNDKNRREIYEGDIIKYDDNEKVMNKWVCGEKALIKYKPSRFVAVMHPFINENFSNINVLKENECEDVIHIIGNKYENPELLEAENETTN